MRKRVLPIMAAALVLLFAACTPKQTESKPQQEKPVPEAQRPEKVENDPAQQEEVNAQPDDVISIVYGDLTFPGMWADRVQYEIEENGADVKIHFTTAVDSEQVPLFTLCYGTVPEDGFEMGGLLVDDERVPVSMVMHPIVPQEGWSEETIKELSDLQESQNDLLVQIQGAPNFTV